MKNKKKELSEEDLSNYSKELSAGAIFKSMIMDEILYGKSGIYISKKGIRKLSQEELLKINIPDTQ